MFWVRANRGLAVALAIAVVAGASADAATDKTLGRVKGTIGFQTAADAVFHRVVGRELVPDDALAITQANSAALIALPDSSLVALGQDTRVQVGAFSNATAAAGPGSAITVENGTLRFDIRRPAGGTANYRFTTTTSQLAVRGTVGLISFLNGETTVACLSCASDSVSLVTGGQTFTIVTGQVLTVSAAGVVTTGALTSTLLSTFAAAQVSTSAAIGPAAAVAGIPGAATGALSGIAIGGIAAGAAIAGVAASGGLSGGQSSSSPAPQVAATPSAILVPQEHRRPTPSPQPVLPGAVSPASHGAMRP
jgi:hypothetical protein